MTGTKFLQSWRSCCYQQNSVQTTPKAKDEVSSTLQDYYTTRRKYLRRYQRGRPQRAHQLTSYAEYLKLWNTSPEL
ncbi:hypothetical protein NPIL_582641 [Nephila pilipes]|uniref:Uncharacterized protein n=1 Tax=Nephila pilipes TaxID=299642 RepID=A0A8X6N0E8_NEPPI|nr:hypothetical protein NPIL_582641 [Nephila pilipes]